MERKYQQIDSDDDFDEYKHIKSSTKTDTKMETDAIQLQLPSINDSKIWRVKCTPGLEKQLVLKITNKLIEYLNKGDPMNVLEVFETQLSEGFIYCEAHKSQHVERVLQGLSGVQMKSLKMIPINEMTEVMNGCKVFKKQKF